MNKPTMSVHKFTSCDGCQLAILNLGETLLALTEFVDIVHFAEAGPVNPDAPADIAFVEGSVSTPAEKERIQRIRKHSRFLITIGACASAGGIQALRNFNDAKAWTADIYASPEYISTLSTSTPISAHAKVDLELWGCPINGKQVLDALRLLLRGISPVVRQESVCLECKRNGNVCVLVTENKACMGPVTQTGCGALCPSAGRDCYACYGPSENPNTDSLATRFAGIGLMKESIARRFHFITNHAPAFLQAGNKYKGNDKT